MAAGCAGCSAAPLRSRRRESARRLSVDQLATGQTASVLSLSGSPNRLAVFGLVPGTEITLLQRRPACVVRVGETELALDLEIARRILVRRPGDSPPGDRRASAADLARP